MKISYNWLKDFLDINIPEAELSEMLTSIGLEVEGIEHYQSVPGGLKGLVVGHVEETQPHPNADRLKLTTVNVGNDEPLQIVCGANNVAAGQKVIVAKVGTTIYPLNGEPFKIEKRKVRGELSMGMICAEDEIGLGTDHDGIMVLSENEVAGSPAKSVVDITEDTVFEIGLTPNRSDATCHLGVAKDLAALLISNENFTGKVAEVNVDAFKIDNENYPIEVDVQDLEACPRYSGLTISGVSIKESPDWLQQKLLALGLKPINNIVDITNFILHDLGQPLHAFDADKIEGKKVVVKKLPNDTPFVTLDEIERKLTDKDLMICNANEKGMCIAGVFGGIDSGVTDQTKNIFLESACFEAIGIRKSSQKHLLRTDAAVRFEKGVDPNNTVYALKRAALLIKELAGGEISSQIVDNYPNIVDKPEITLRYQQLNRLAGIEIPKERTDAILSNMEMDILSADDEKITVKVPTNKVDVLREVDLIEEVLRIYGFNNIPIINTVNSTLSYESEADKKAKLQNNLSDFLAGQGFQEMMNVSISQSKYYEEVMEQGGVVPILNSQTSELDSLRRNMIFSGLETISFNQKRKNFNLNLFEFGTTYFQKEVGSYIENQKLSIYIAGNATEESWRKKAEKSSFFDLKAVVTNVIQKCGIHSYKTGETTNELFAYGLCYKAMNGELVNMGMLKPDIIAKMDAEGPVFAAIIDWDLLFKIAQSQEINFSPIPKYPAVKRDVALVVNKTVGFKEIEDISRKIGKKLMTEINLFDVYMDDDKLGPDKKSYAVSFTFLDETKTLTKKEVDKLMSKMVYQFEQQLSAQQK